MADTINNFSALVKYTQTKYAQALINTIPENQHLQRKAPFSRGTRIGREFAQAVVTGLEQGFTYRRASAPYTALEDAVQQSIDEAIIDLSQGILRSVIDYDLLGRATVKEQGIAYGSAVDQLYKSMIMSGRRRAEISMWVGRHSLGVGAVASTAGNDIVITAASWASGFWVGMDNVMIEVFTSDLLTKRGVAKVTGVNPATKTITVDSVPGLTAAGDVIHFKSAVIEGATPTYNDMLGLVSIALTTTGNLFGVPVSKSIWLPNQFAVGGPVTFAKIQDMAILSMIKGHSGRAQCYLPLESYNDALVEQAALRRYGGDFDGRAEFVQGAQGIRFWTAAGELEIFPTTYLPGGYSLICPEGSLKTIGTSDLTFKIPGLGSANVHIADKEPGVSMRLYYAKALFTGTPGQLTVGTGVTS